MKIVVIPVGYRYSEKGDIVLRSYVRALKKANLKQLLSLGGNIAYVVGEIDENGRFIEYFTKKEIPCHRYELASDNVIKYLIAQTSNERVLCKGLMLKCLFGKSIDLGFEISTLEERDSDIHEEVRGYEEGLSAINPYEGNFMDYDNFLLKVNKACDSTLIGDRNGYLLEKYNNVATTYCSIPQESDEKRK